MTPGSLHDEVLGEELGEALHIVELVGVDVVIVELLEDRQIFGGLLGVVDLLVPFLCGSVLAAVQVVRCGVADAGLQRCPAWFVTTRRTVLPTRSQSLSCRS